MMDRARIWELMTQANRTVWLVTYWGAVMILGLFVLSLLGTLAVYIYDLVFPHIVELPH